MKKCSYIICYEFNHTAVFNPSKHIFEMECLAHVISGACKVCVFYVQY